MAAAIERLLVDKTLRMDIIQAGRQRIMQHFDNREWTQELAQVYRAAIPELSLPAQDWEPIAP